MKINHLSDGMKVGLTDKVEKHSEKLGRDAVFTLKSRITRLPRYLCIQVRARAWVKDLFFWEDTRVFWNAFVSLLTVASPTGVSRLSFFD